LNGRNFRHDSIAEGIFIKHGWHVVTHNASHRRRDYPKILPPSSRFVPGTRNQCSSFITSQG
jgi:hypothetical protein